MTRTPMCMVMIITSVMVMISILMLIPFTTSAHSGDSIGAGFSTAPTIDGTLSPGEWDDSDYVYIQGQNSETINVYYKHDRNNLYIGFDTNSDYLAEIYLDTYNDGGLRPQNDDFLLHASGTLYDQQGNGYDWGNTNYEITGWNASTMYEGSGQIEYRISFTKIGITPGPSVTTGISFGIMDPTGIYYFYYWPSDANRKIPDSWADISYSEIDGSDDNQLPTAYASADKTSGTAPLTVAFTGFGEDGDGVIQSYLWYFDDGIYSSEQNPTHVFQYIGTYHVEFSVTDNDYASNSTFITIVVTEENNGDGQPPDDETPDDITESGGEQEEESTPGFEASFFIAAILMMLFILKNRERT
ncbi:MAG: PKD domain-containing protein [Thermoplasmata archaeon]|nr:MAG: PKD domain-containing protein [Thermoplasmata archaeon]